MQALREELKTLNANYEADIITYKTKMGPHVEQAVKAAAKSYAKTRVFPSDGLEKGATFKSVSSEEQAAARAWAGCVNTKKYK